MTNYMETMRAVYIVAEDGEYAERMRRFWAGMCPTNDPLYELMYPRDLRGEVTAWGENPHWTILDAMTIFDPDGFDAIIRDTCRKTSNLTIEPRELDMWGNGLMMKCDSPSSESLRDKLAASTRSYIARSPISDEEFQRGEWWIRQICGNQSHNIDLLRELRAFYRNAGLPAVPSSRHFRLGFLMYIYKSIRNAEASKDSELVSITKAAMDSFLKYGEPQWYHKAYKSHTTIVSGLHVNSDERSVMLERFRKLIQPEAIRQLGEIYRPSYLAIMGEDPGKMMNVHFYDWLTETFVEETRPNLTVLERVPLAS